MKEFVLPSNKRRGIGPICLVFKTCFRTKADSIKQCVEPESTIVRVLIERQIVVIENSRNSVKVDEELRRLVVVLHHQLFKLDLGFGLLVVRAEVDVKPFGEILEVRKPFGFVCPIVDEEGFEVIESHSLQEGQNIVDLGSVVEKVFQLGLKVEFALQEDAPKLLRVHTIEWIGVPEFSLRCCRPIPTSISASHSSAVSN
jgi:hypothetical protein